MEAPDFGPLVRLAKAGETAIGCLAAVLAIAVLAAPFGLWWLVNHVSLVVR